MPVTQTLQVERAGAFVRALQSRGAPSDAISIGVNQGRPELSTMWFYIRSLSEINTYYEKLKLPKIQTIEKKAPTPVGSEEINVD